MNILLLTIIFDETNDPNKQGMCFAKMSIKNYKKITPCSDTEISKINKHIDEKEIDKF